MDREQREVYDLHLAGGLVGYIQRMRASHGPTFGRDRNGVLFAGICRCGEVGCNAPYWLCHIDDLIAAYEAKVEDLGAETLRSTRHREALWWVLNGARNGQPFDQMMVDGYAPPEVLDLIRSVAGQNAPSRSERAS